ncbi:MAG TPA: transposase [Nitrososphaerales archaeon]|nr:transposase [Nitrososphaerales archaeon]
MPSARKSFKESYHPTTEVLALMREFMHMTNDCIGIGLARNATALKRLSLVSYKELNRYNVPSYYKLCAISKASGILASRKKSIKRGVPTKASNLGKPLLVSCYGFKIVSGKVVIPLGNRRFEEIQLTKHAQCILSDPKLKVNSFTLTETSLSLCISKDVPLPDKVTGTIGIDRNLRNVCVGNKNAVIYYDMSKIIQIGETTKDILKSLKRNDVRIRKEICSKYGKRKTERVKRILHAISKDVVQKAKENRQRIVFEDIRNIRRMYHKGNYQGKDYRRQMNNHWPFAEIKRQIEYKAQWSGVPIIHLTKSETNGTSSLCYQCGERLQGDRSKPRQLWCQKCEKWFDRDMVAVMNISRRGWLKFDHSPQKGDAGEAMVQEPSKEAVILRVDASKSISKSGQIKFVRQIS